MQGETMVDALLVTLLACEPVMSKRKVTSAGAMASQEPAMV